MKKRLIALMLAAITLFALAIPAYAAAPKIKETEYEGNGRIEVDFSGKVSYKNVKVTVANAAGKRFTAVIVEKDDDDLTFLVQNLKAGVKYTYVISGVRKGKSGAYGTVKDSFKVPAASGLRIKEVEYDADDRELDIDFNKKVSYKSAKVVVKDADGKTYAARITEKDDDDMEVRVQGLKYGERYTVTVSGVAVRGTKKYETLTAEFAAIDN